MFQADGVSGWAISHGERAGLGGLSSEHPWPLPAFGGFPFISFQQVLPSCRSPYLRGNVSRGHRRHRSFAVPAGGLFEGRTSLTQGSAADRLPCMPCGPTFHFSAHPCPHCADTVPVAALSSSSHHPEVPVEGTGAGCVGAGTLQRWEMPRFLQARMSPSHDITPSPGDHSSAVLSTDSLHKPPGWRYGASPCQQIPCTYHSYFLLCRRRSPASAAPQAARRL